MTLLRNWAYLCTGVILPDTQLFSAVQVDITSLARELEHVEREVVGCSQSIALHLHCLVSRVRAAAQKQEKKMTGTAKTG